MKKDRTNINLFPQRKTLMFETVIEYKKLFVTYDLFANGQKSLVTVEHNELPIDIIALEVFHHEMYAEILAAMDNNAYSHNREEVEHLFINIFK